MSHVGRRLQYSLRSLLVTIAVLATALGGFLAWWQRMQSGEQMRHDSRWNRDEAATVELPDGYLRPHVFREVYEFYLDLQALPVRHGLATVYDLEGRKLREETWRHGRLHGEWTDWGVDGAPLRAGEYRDGKPHTDPTPPRQ